ncbi:hypothetical protein [Archangium sp.]|uniref:hypothetical protein n=1 Tax=Archangium sp. TaxID=1872627 RepID=UPI00286C4F85|nr:hypothetical protein [Archangium sp.]
MKSSNRVSPRGRLVPVRGWLGLALALGTLPAAAQTPPAPVVTVSPVLPTDIPGGAPNATLQQAAVFAWQEFIALNWPAVKQEGQQGNRETADTAKWFSDPRYTSAERPLVWHTYRGKVEIFPGYGVPPGSVPFQFPKLTNLGSPAQPYFGYDALPSYVYGQASIPPATTPGTATPWINLDEKTQIGLDQIYAGVASANTKGPGNQLLFLAKANRTEFDYLAPLGWWNGPGGKVPFKATTNYIQNNRVSPPAGSTQYVSFPSGTIELKAAWRQLAPTEDASRFYTTTARYYVNSGGTPQYVDDTFALVALHIIHKTPSAPYFIFATFEQADNITDVNGHPVEDEDGKFIGAPAPSAFSPGIVSHNATAGDFQRFSLEQSDVRAPRKQLYFVNTPSSGLVEGTVLVNRRKHAIPRDVVLVNQAAHQAIASYVQKNLPGTKSPWMYYKLVNVQSAPIGGKIPGSDYTKADAATYYQANSVVETDYNLQVFSGRFYQGTYNGLGNTITDFDFNANGNGTPTVNVVHAQQGYNMGGCMGCHGNAQRKGADFSFILLGGPVTAPDTISVGPSGTGAMVPAGQGGGGSPLMQKLLRP